MGIDPNAKEPLQLANTGHPAASNFTLAHAVQSEVNAFGLSWATPAVVTTVSTALYLGERIIQAPMIAASAHPRGHCEQRTP